MKRPIKFHFQQVIVLIIALCLGTMAAFVSYSQILKTPDEFITNYIYQYNPFEKADSRITIIAIDSSTEDKYGKLTEWSRSQLADAVNILSDKNASVIGLDVNLTKEKDSDGDNALVEACKKSGNVVAIANANFMNGSNSKDSKPNGKSDTEDESTTEDDSMDVVKPAAPSTKWSEQTPDKINYPFSTLKEVVTCGVSNALQQSHDGTVRTAALRVNYGNDNIDSFAVAIYKKYQDLVGESYKFPELDNQNQFGFTNIYDTNSYQVISFNDLIDGNYNSDYIDNHIVFVGKYDSSVEKINYFEYMRSDYAKQEILVESAVLQALLTQRVVLDLSADTAAIICAVFILFLYILTSRLKPVSMILAHILAIACHILGGGYANYRGCRYFLLVPLIFIIISLFSHMLYDIIRSTIEKKKMESTLKLYVDKQIVDEITEVSPFALGSVSERRNVAILFVDIRGFTTLSESLDPEEVVKILNDYFSVVYASIQAWNGTLDKFIGDAAMAIFNAPKEHDNYIYNAVCAADDIIKGFEEIKYKFQVKYDKDIAIGIGVNCGEAIVGNIGCVGRMDYTAIGDTVNTASRLESKASPGQILISEPVREAIAEQSETSLIGELSLKGKTKAVTTYEIKAITKTEAPNEIARKEYLRENYLLHTKFRPNR